MQRVRLAVEQNHAGDHRRVVALDPLAPARPAPPRAALLRAISSWTRCCEATSSWTRSASLVGQAQPNLGGDRRGGVVEDLLVADVPVARRRVGHAERAQRQLAVDGHRRLEVGLAAVRPRPARRRWPLRNSSKRLRGRAARRSVPRSASPIHSPVTTVRPASGTASAATADPVARRSAAVQRSSSGRGSGLEQAAPQQQREAELRVGVLRRVVGLDGFHVAVNLVVSVERLIMGESARRISGFQSADARHRLRHLRTARLAASSRTLRSATRGRRSCGPRLPSTAPRLSGRPRRSGCTRSRTCCCTCRATSARPERSPSSCPATAPPWWSRSGASRRARCAGAACGRWSRRRWRTRAAR